MAVLALIIVIFLLIRERRKKKRLLQEREEKENLPSTKSKDSVIATPRWANSTYSLNEVDQMEGHEFEYWCADLLKYDGFDSIQVTPRSGDQGVDIIARKNSIKYAIQCKRYSRKLDNTPIQEVLSGSIYYDCSRAVVMTNQYFTSAAISFAKAFGVLLWDRDYISRLNYQKYASQHNNNLNVERAFPVDPVSLENGKVKCPLCGTEQRPNRNLCMECGVLFASQIDVSVKRPSTPIWKCRCGRFNQWHVSTCVCGETRSDAVQTNNSPVVPIPLNNEKEKCPVCGSIQRAERNLCMECGTRFVR
jgi:hypothetical protein